MARHETQALWALAAGELPSKDRLRVEAHVAACPECAEALEQVRRSRALLAGARTVEPSVRWVEVGGTLKDAAARRLARPEPRPRWTWGLALAGACAAALALWMLAPPHISGPRTREPVRVAEALPMPAPTPVVRPGPALPEGEGTPRVELAGATETESAAGAVLRESGGTERALASGMRLRSGMAVRTPPRASALLRLPDASRVRVSAGSEVVLAQAEASEVHLTVNQGRLAVRASHAQRRGFVVEAAGLRVSVVGTVFSVERTEDGAAVAVLEGRVRVETEGQPPRFVDAGERVELRAAERALKPRELSSEDRRAFRELEAPLPAPAPKQVAPLVANAPRTPSSVAPAVVAPAPKQDETSVASAAVQETLTAPQAPTPPGGAPPRGEPAPEPPAMARATPEPTQEFAPYPAPSASSGFGGEADHSPVLALPAPALAPSEPPRRPQQEPRSRTWSIKLPGLPRLSGGLMSKDADERFLGYATVQMGARTCEGFLVGLEEIAERSPRTDHREKARYLRARCFQLRLDTTSAEDEYRHYLRDFPDGPHASEAHAVLSPTPVLGAPQEERRPASTPTRVDPPRIPGGGPWPGMGSAPREPVSPGGPRRW